MPPTVRIRFYATAREVVGAPHLSLAIPPSGTPARAVVVALGARFPRLRPILRTSRFLRNDRYLDSMAETLRPGDEFAVHPPYSGG